MLVSNIQTKILKGGQVEQQKNKWLDLQSVSTAAPIIIALGVIFMLQAHIFVSPADLEKKHRIILEEIAEKYATKKDIDYLKEKVEKMDSKIDKIYDLMKRG